MKDFAPSVLVAILHEMFGSQLWIFAALAALLLTLGIVGLLQRRYISKRAWTMALVVALIASILASLLALTLTSATLANVHGLLDWASLGAIALLGFVSVLWVAYVSLSRLSPIHRQEN